MITIGIDPHKDTHTAAAVEDATGQLLGELTVPGTEKGHRELLVRIGELTRAEEALQAEIAVMIRPLAPGLLAVSGIGDLIAARLVVEIGGAERFSSEAALARHAGCAPIEVSSGRVRRHRLSRLGNRKLNAALHQVV